MAKQYRVTGLTKHINPPDASAGELERAVRAHPVFKLHPVT